ncbi:MAG: hypothetical protein M1822_000883 [Bathelium mastoideum]|nr:MAG: hypothetical protein M1822_000883 [Bathelium mastoideum]
MTGRSLDKVDSAKSEIEATDIKGTLTTLQLDVTDDASIQKAAAFVQEKYGRLDALINNAGVASRVPSLKIRMETNFQVNVIGAAMVAEAFRPILLKSQNPYSIWVSSGSGSLARAAEPPRTYETLTAGGVYQASKAAMNMLAVMEYRAYGTQGLKVFPLAPGFVVSNLRGTSEEDRTGWGGAGDPMVSGQTILGVIQGKRDADVCKLVNKDGVHPW